MIKGTKTAIIMAPGPSLTKHQVVLATESGALTVGIGDVGRLYDIDVHYHCDAKWWNYYRGCPDSRAKVKFSLEQSLYPEIKCLERSELPSGELDFTYPKIVTGNNSGYQAINVAWHSLPYMERLILIGYDLKDTEDGKHNIIGHHPKEIRRPYNFQLFRENIQSLAPFLANKGIKVYNCTIDSALQGYERAKLEDVL